MRWLLATAAIILAAPAIAQENEAEKLFRAMERKVREAKSGKVVFEGDIALEGQTFLLKGSVNFAEGNKARIELDGNFRDMPLPIRVVSDGKLQVIEMKGVKQDPKPTEPKMAELLSRMGRAGPLFGMLPRAKTKDQKTEEFELDQILPVSNFKLGPKERIGDRDAQVVEFTLKDESVLKLTVFKGQVWIDTKTLTPLKRRYTAIVFTEFCREFSLDLKLDPKLFELPK